MLRTFLVYILLTLLLGSSSARKPRHRKHHVPHRRYDGIDVSHHQGIINWQKVARNPRIKFVYIKATQGVTITDELYCRNIREARKYGLQCGSYHFLSSSSPVRAQFRHFCAVVKESQQDLIPMVDIEREGVKGWSRKQMQDSLSLFVRLLKSHYGKSPLVYSQVNFYNKNLAPQFNRYFLFLGKYNAQRPQIKGLGKHNIWQFSERGRVEGIRGFVDLNRFMSGTSIRHIRL
uniref:Glycosyl hydrolase family 25 n=1 Tax=Prevotella sp. GTC17259 TaxID=3236795 RepID=A0AB33J0T9_9BACT